MYPVSVGMMVSRAAAWLDEEGISKVFLRLALESN
jgi:hypothetical protein